MTLDQLHQEAERTYRQERDSLLREITALGGLNGSARIEDLIRLSDISRSYDRDLSVRAAASARSRLLDAVKSGAGTSREETAGSLVRVANILLEQGRAELVADPISAAETILRASERGTRRAVLLLDAVLVGAQALNVQGSTATAEVRLRDGARLAAELLKSVDVEGRDLVANREVRIWAALGACRRRMGDQAGAVAAYREYVRRGYGLWGEDDWEFEEEVDALCIEFPALGELRP